METIHTVVIEAHKHNMVYLYIEKKKPSRCQRMVSQVEMHSHPPKTHLVLSASLRSCPGFHGECAIDHRGDAEWIRQPEKVRKLESGAQNILQLTSVPGLRGKFVHTVSKYHTVQRFINWNILPQPRVKFQGKKGDIIHFRRRVGLFPHNVVK